MNGIVVFQLCLVAINIAVSIIQGQIYSLFVAGFCAFLAMIHWEKSN